MLEPPLMLWEDKRVADAAMDAEGARVVDEAGEMLEPSLTLWDGTRVADGAREVEVEMEDDMEQGIVRVPCTEREVVRDADKL